MSIEDDLHLGGRAREVLENEAYIAAFDAIKQELIGKWENSPVRDEDGREKLWLMLWSLNKVQAALSATMDSGKLARAELNHRQSLADRAKSWAGVA
ncbi:MAG: hypothetical protein V4505_25650 [Pseudomonadota bacterium]